MTPVRVVTLLRLACELLLLRVAMAVCRPPESTMVNERGADERGRRLAEAGNAALKDRDVQGAFELLRNGFAKNPFILPAEASAFPDWLEYILAQRLHEHETRTRTGTWRVGAISAAERQSQ